MPRDIPTVIKIASRKILFPKNKSPTPISVAMKNITDKLAKGASIDEKTSKVFLTLDTGKEAAAKIEDDRNRQTTSGLPIL
tara:strand:+ start:388 stop:630 length:243 start_codon:yes stop_codon:yes gene_type:complete